MRWGKKKKNKGLTYDQAVMLILKQAPEIVGDNIEILKNELADDESKLMRVHSELFYFLVFAIDYCWQNDPSYTQEQKGIFENIFSSHLNILFGDDAEGKAMWATLEDRFIDYGQIVNEQKDDSGRWLFWGMKLSEYCEMPNALFLALVPRLFTTALELVSVFRAER